ncbi:phage major capsid protein [Altererythrobacter sp. SALINAS58]|uniref:phage major capsid protein n=1 Tax=Alteripontixanthobacter muriae TaxID=2705546 RepID=UPI0015770CEF|nr:phage major capsid protein [Alteripontixanthobacter muriae]NTZ44045.1 phage major capsid protein [Alteripontixanthobacter muriae]
MNLINAPRAMCGSVRAETDPNQLLLSLRDTVQGFQARYDNRVNAMEGAVERLLDRSEAQVLGSPNGDDGGFFGTSWGSQVASNDEVRAFASQAGRGKVSVPLGPQAMITSVDSGGGSFITPDRATPVTTARRTLRVRSLLGQGRTRSNTIDYVRQTARNNGAAMVAEGALKPESTFAFELKQTAVRTMAHWTLASRQVLDDAEQLRTIIDGEMRYGLALVEEQQLLLGDGVGQNLLGLIPQATAYDAAVTPAGASKFDVLLMAIRQAELADLPATGVIVNAGDWMALQTLKDGQGRYIGTGPFGQAQPQAWGLPVAPSNSMPAGKFLVGAFATAATVYDRMEPVVLLSTEDADNFRRNLVTILAEERLGLAVRRPEALIYGDYSAAEG